MKLAIIGATGLVGRAFLRETERLSLPVDRLVLAASGASAGKRLYLYGKARKVEELSPDVFDGVDFALFSAGREISREYVPIAVKKGVRVVDNGSFFRMKEGVPLVVPEINFSDVGESPVIANPNCSTITAILALNALKKFGLTSVRYVTFQSASGAGRKGLDDLTVTLRGENPRFFPASLAKNCIPKIDDFLPDGYTGEEEKMRNETKKILHLPDLSVSATCVRVPVPFCHGVAVSAELKENFTLNEIREEWKKQDGVVVADDTCHDVYPLGEMARCSDKTFVGRLRRDTASENGITFYCVADNLYKGSASNAVEIVRRLVCDE